MTHEISRSRATGALVNVAAAHARGYVETPGATREINAQTRAIAVADIRALEREEGRVAWISDLARLAPHARLNGVGLTMAELATKLLPGKRGKLTFAGACVDKNGDLDVSRYFGGELRAQAPAFLMHNGDERPLGLDQVLRASTLIVNDPAQVATLKRQRHWARGQGVKVDLRNTGELLTALRAFNIDPQEQDQVADVLAEAGVIMRSLKFEDRLRRALLARCNSPLNALDVPRGLDGDAQATIYTAAKVNPARTDEVVFTYKRFNSFSSMGQGLWTAKLFGDASVHQGDAETAFFKFDGNVTSSILCARHLYGEQTNASALAAWRERTGAERTTLSISHLAHGSRLAERDTARTWAGNGPTGVQWFDPFDHIVKDLFLGLEDVKTGKATLLAPDGVRLISEYDDMQAMNLQVCFGMPTGNVFGKFVSGTTFSRRENSGTAFFYEQAARG